MSSGKNNRHGKGIKFLNQKGPSVPPPKTYEPTRSAQKPHGYAAIEAAAQLAQDDPEFLAFVQNVVMMPVEMAPAVSEAIRQQKWKINPNPLAVVRTGAHQEARRMGIDAPGPPVRRV